MNAPIRIGALISGGGTNLQAIIDACESGAVDGRMAFVGSDNPGAGGLERARRHGIPHFVVDYADIIRRFRSRPESVQLPPDFDFEACQKKQHIFPEGAPRDRISEFLRTRAAAEFEILKQIEIYEMDLLVLAGFMRNLTPYFIDRLNSASELPRIMNIHPAILPAFPGTDGYGDTFRYGCKVGGCTVHFVDYGEDSGPIIGQRAFPIQPGDTVESIKKKGLEQEWILYPECIQLYARKKLHLAFRQMPQAARGSLRRAVVDIDP